MSISAAKLAANRKYDAKTYKQIGFKIRKSEYPKIENYVKSHGLSNSKFFLLCAEYIIKNDIDITTIENN